MPSACTNQSLWRDLTTAAPLKASTLVAEAAGPVPKPDMMMLPNGFDAVELELGIGTVDVPTTKPEDP